ncbi:MAG: mechanosensitive ion channel [Candidatus Gracilibacteria bacterium]|nr:mechanosensitive ion channel [Candidatus Gracilibacteria bacterium]
MVIFISSILIIALNVLFFYIKLTLKLPEATMNLLSQANIIITGLLAIVIFLKFINSFLDKLFGKLSKTSTKKVFPLFRKIIDALIFLFGFVFVLALAGINVSALLAGAGISGIVIAFASKEAITNIFGSLSIIFNKNFDIGDTIKFKEYEGEVVEITLSCTKIIDKNGNFVYIPNKGILEQEISNISKNKDKIIDLNFILKPEISAKNLKNLVNKIEKFLDGEKEKLSINKFSVSLGDTDDKGQRLTMNLNFNRADFKLENKNEIVIFVKEEIEKIVGC